MSAKASRTVAAGPTAFPGKQRGTRGHRDHARYDCEQVLHPVVHFAQKQLTFRGSNRLAVTLGTGLLSAVVRKKLGLNLVSEVGKDGQRRYRVIDSGDGAGRNGRGGSNTSGGGSGNSGGDDSSEGNGGSGTAG